MSDTSGQPPDASGAAAHSARRPDLRPGAGFLSEHRIPEVRSVLRTRGEPILARAGLLQRDRGSGYAARDADHRGATPQAADPGHLRPSAAAGIRRRPHPGAEPNTVGTLLAERGPFPILLNGRRTREWRQHFGELKADVVALPSTSHRPRHWNTPRPCKEALAEWCAALRSAGIPRR